MCPCGGSLADRKPGADLQHEHSQQHSQEGEEIPLAEPEQGDVSGGDDDHPCQNLGHRARMSSATDLRISGGARLIVRSSREVCISRMRLRI